MKKFYTLVAVAFVGFIGNAQIVNIPDPIFKARLLQAGPFNVATNSTGGNLTIDANNDGEIQVSEALQVYTLTVSYRAITDMTGIESFTNLRELYCEHDQITTLNVSNLIHLEKLRFDYNQLSGTLDVSMMPNLKYLNFESNDLTALNITGLTNIEHLNCSRNHISSLNVTNLTQLKSLYCWYNDLTSLDVTNLTALEFLYFSYNHIPTITVTGLTNLKEIACNGNQMAALDLTGLNQLLAFQCADNIFTSLDLSDQLNLLTLDCSSNPITSLDLTGMDQLQYLQFESCPITSIDLSQLHDLQSLFCGNTSLTTLDVSNNHNLWELFCQHNQLTSLNMKNGYDEDFDFSDNPNLEYICADESQLLAVEDAVIVGFPNCHVNTYCSFTPGGTFYTINGNNRYDNNNNGCDTGDINFPNLKLSVSDGTNTGNLIPDENGSYHYDVQAGTHTLTPILENPGYFTVSPASATISFPAAANPMMQDFCIAPNGSHNDLEVSLFPIGAARPGFDAYYRIIYKNKGNTIQNGSVSLNFFDPIMDLVFSNPTQSSQATNMLYWDFTNLLPFETREIIVTFNINSPVETPPVNAGNLEIYTATITGATDETPADNTSILTQSFVNSYDPNDKTCIEGLNLPTYKVGEYVHYIIHFENSGTANAENIVVKDMIDTTKFDINTLIPLGGSHSYVTRITSTNNVEFIFENINLPFDDANNDGFVAFKIKTKPTLTDGDFFSNSADIYFDYNAPIVTDPYVTAVYNPLSVPGFEFDTMYSLSPVPTKDTLTITTKQDVVMSSVNIYNTLGQLVQVNTNPSETIDVSGLKTGSYFIKIISDKGTASSKFIKE